MPLVELTWLILCIFAVHIICILTRLYNVNTFRMVQKYSF